MFTPTQLVVYPAQGVGVVERIERREMGGGSAEFYIVRILGNNVTLMVPVRNAINVGLRELSNRETCLAVMADLEEHGNFTGYTGQNWNRRYREYSERLKTGKLSDSAHVLKDLLLIGGEKDLSFGERRLMEQALSLVSMEIACVLGQEQEVIQQRIEAIFSDTLAAQAKNT